jgi:dolichyl-diphosphooligosaccharide--protein glycosyltransferase
VLVLLVAGLGFLFAYTSATKSYIQATQSNVPLIPDWREALEWLGKNTPETGVDYLAISDPKTFEYPGQSYGVMSWWDYGHMITYIAKRIPNANPFQQGVAGPDGAAAYFITTSEDAANDILDHDGTRYVVTDILMDASKFPAMATWYNSSLAVDPYMKYMFIPGSDDPNRLEPRFLNTEQYYLTMVSRLHNFDGSMTPATTVYYVEYSDPGVTGVSLPVVTNAKAMNATAAVQSADQFNRKAPAGYHALALGTSLVNPVGDIPALRHYRLIHEFPTNVFNAKTPDVKYVKVFEYVKGAHIKGNGIIELPLVSNTGRNFTYRQESIDGEFVVPFSTTGNPYGGTATGNYRFRSGVRGTGIGGNAGQLRQLTIPFFFIDYGLLRSIISAPIRS